MKKLQEADVIKDYASFRDYACSLYLKQSFNECLNYISLCSKIAYTFNFIYTDPILEDILDKIGSSVIDEKEVAGQADKYVLYDYFGLDNRGLTQQYMRGLIQLEKEFLYVLDGEGVVNGGNDILNELKSYSNATIYVLKETSYLKKIKEVTDVIANYQPSVALLHLSPWDVVGVTFWNKYPIKRFFINLTDHAFWLGVNSADYFLEFRPFGFEVSTQARGIPRDRLRLLPYYPIQKESKFQGFPVDVTGKVIGFSGASFYKIYGKGGKFLELIKKVLEENKDFIFFFAGSGVDGPLKKFIRENGFENRFILLGNRSDINAVFKNIDIYINTYPLIGALMTQLAVVNGKPIVTYTSRDLAFNLIEGFLTSKEGKNIRSMFSVDEFTTEINRLIADPNYRAKNVENYCGSVPTRQEFEKNLQLVLDDCLEELVTTDNIEIDYNAVKQLYLETENDFVQSYDFLKLAHLRSSYFYHFPSAAFSSLFRVLNSDKKLILYKRFQKFWKKEI